MSSLQQIVSCLDGYDPDALPVDTARAAIRSVITPVSTNERVAVRASLGRVLGEDIVSTVNVPAHDNSAMDGWAVRCSDLETRRRDDAARGRRRLRGPEVRRPRAAGRMRAGDDRRGDAARHRHGRDPGSGPRRRRPDRRAAGAAGGPEPPPRGRRPRRRESRAARGPAAPAGRARADGLARPRRGRGAAQAPRRLLLHRRRARFGRDPAAGRRGLRLQPLHAVRDARAARRAR